MRETEFKQTEIGLIPSDWEVKTIGDFTNVVTGATPNTKISEFWGGNIRWMNSGELNLKRVHEVAGRITELGYESASTFMLPPYCVLIGLAGQGKTRGTAAINYVPLCTNQSIAAFTPNDKFDSFFLYFFMDSQYENLRRISSGDGGRGGLSKGLLEDYKVIFPPLPEQRKIAEVLSDFDELIDSLSALIAKKENIKQGAMQELLTARRRLPGFTDPWVEKPLGEVTAMQSGGTPLSSNNEYYNGTIPFLSIGDMTAQNKWINYTANHISESGLLNSSARMCAKGTLLYAMYASLGKCSIANIDLAISQAVLGIDCKNIERDFLYYYLCFIEGKVVKMGQTGTQSNLSKQIVQEFIVPIPTPSEQRAIAAILSDMDSEISALKVERDKYLSLKQGAMQQLLCGKIRLV